MTWRLAAVFAHPDDDAYQIGGLLALHAEELRVTLVLATSGGAGPITFDGLATRETLAEVREGEEREFLEAVGAAHSDVRFLRYPDYHLDTVPREALTSRISAILREAQPHVVVTFGPDGVTSHHDHIAVGAAATAAFHRTRAGAGRGGSFLRLYYTALPQSEIDRFYGEIRKRGIPFGEPGDLFLPVGVPDERITVKVDCTPVLATKVRGVLAHRTQLSELEMIPQDLRWIYIHEERFVQAWPEPSSSAGTVRTNLFYDLEPGPDGPAAENP